MCQLQSLLHLHGAAVQKPIGYLHAGYIAEKDVRLSSNKPLFAIWFLHLFGTWLRTATLLVIFPSRFLDQFFTKTLHCNSIRSRMRLHPAPRAIASHQQGYPGISSMNLEAQTFAEEPQIVPMSSRETSSLAHITD